ncbi:hypothetical protein DMN91_005987 [Ooceraea biroi]|uniref:MIT domain-containing protein n=1 Tax=Ooceraea biroi TaxID=2015173 RepID=A0A3L8DMF8_OOCBI|nr:hypothetical protein DMN91_005987 [Ooceraea biroi]
MPETLDEALLAARRAVQFDGNGQYKQALYYYDIAIKLLVRLQLDDTYEQKLADYRERILAIQRLVHEEEQNNQKTEPSHQSELQRCKFLMNQALDADEAGLKDIAVKLYTDAAELGLSAKTNDTDVKAKLTNLVRVAVERAESLKGIKTTEDESIMKSLARLPSVPETSLPDTEQSVEEEQPVNAPSTTPGFIYVIMLDNYII